MVATYEKEKGDMKIDKVAILVKKAALESDKISNSFFGKCNLSASQYKVLKYLYAQETRTARVVDLERKFSMTHPTTLGLLEQLEKRGLTKRIPNPNDARGKLVALTEKANSMQEELEALGDSVEAKVTEYLTSDEREELIHLLKKLMNIKN